MQVQFKSILDDLELLLKTNWYGRPNPEDPINRKPEDQKNDQRTKNTKNQKTKK